MEQSVGEEWMAVVFGDADHFEANQIIIWGLYFYIKHAFLSGYAEFIIWTDGSFSEVCLL